MNMVKIRRNDPCPCGSGDKYKKCCIDSGPESFDDPVIGTSEPTYDFLMQHNSIDLLKTFAGLSIIPENHGKYLRLEELVTHTLLAYSEQSAIGTMADLKLFLDKHFAEESMEDICVNPFTDLITFYGGDYLTFPGITENGQEILTNQLTAIFQWPYAQTGDEFKTNVKHVVKLGLVISNKIAKRLGYNRYMADDNKDSLISIPPTAKLDTLKRAVVFTTDEMRALIEENHIAPQALAELLLDRSFISKHTLYTDNNPIHYRPIIKAGDEYIVLSPATIGLALTDIIWRFAKQWDLARKVNDAYHDVIWNSLQLQLGQLEFNHADVAKFNHESGFRDGMYTFDSDKIAYIAYIGDNNGQKKPGSGADRTQLHRADSAIKALSSDPRYCNHQCLALFILSGVGRTFYYPLRKVSGAQTLVIPAFDIETLWLLKNTTAVDLWKFTAAKDELYAKLDGFKSFSSFMDEYKLYKDKADSFYLSDESPVVIPTIVPGYAKEWLLTSKLNRDMHSVLDIRDGKLLPIQVEKKDGSAPIYVHLMDIASSNLRFATEGFHQPIWVAPIDIPKSLSGDLRSIYYQLTDAIAYWLWQVQDEIKDDLLPLGNEPLVVNFKLDPASDFDDIDRNFDRKENLSGFFNILKTRSGFMVTIPSEVISYLYGAENEGERVLLEQLLIGFNQVLETNGKTQISAERITAIIEKCAPLGMKKKFFILDSSDNLLLDPRNIKSPRYVQEYDVSVVLSSIVPGLGTDCPPIGDIKTQPEKNELAKKIANEVLMNLLLAKLAKLDSIELLKCLIGMNESLIHKREELRIHTPTRIACFVSVEQQEENLQESLSNLNRTTIATRCLIEQIAAQPFQGKEPISFTSVDEIIAIMDQIIAWGSISDQLHFNLFDINMGVLPSGRIGTEKTMYNDIFDPYYKSKTSEDVKDAISTFKQVFPQNESETGGNIPAKLDKAFLSDYGVSLNRICAFIDGLATIGFLQSTDYAYLPLKDLRNQINKYVPSFEETEFSNVLNYLSLEDRGTLLNIDKKAGYEYIDVMPWRFNRMLSHMRKPVTITGKPGESDRQVFWGPRQVLASRIYLAEQCQSDRLRVLKTSASIKKALGEFATKRGARLVKNIIKAIDPSGLIVDEELFIGPQYEWKHFADIGDIDVLIIDPAEHTLYSLEAKSMSPSRNIKEMIEEVSKLFGSYSDDGWVDKHMKRDEWIKNNLDQIGKKYGIDMKDFTVRSLFVTEESMLTPYLRKMSLPLPFLTSYDIEEKGLSIIKDATK